MRLSDISSGDPAVPPDAGLESGGVFGGGVDDTFRLRRQFRVRGGFLLQRRVQQRHGLIKTKVRASPTLRDNAPTV